MIRQFIPFRLRQPAAGAAMAMALAFAVASAAPAGAAQPLEPAQARAAVETLHDGLEHIMANGPDLGMSGRADYIDEVVDAAYNLRGLTAQAIGPSTFRGFEPEEQEDLVQAYRGFVIANYASQFARPNSLSFETGEVSDGPGSSLMVTTSLIPRAGDPVTLSYIVSQTGDGAVGIVDVLHNGVSESARRRSEFARLAAEGAAPLSRAIRAKAEEIASGAE